MEISFGSFPRLIRRVCGVGREERRSRRGREGRGATRSLAEVRRLGKRGNGKGATRQAGEGGGGRAGERRGWGGGGGEGVGGGWLEVSRGG